MTVGEVTMRLAFVAGAEQAKKNVTLIRAAIAERHAEITSLQALLRASFALCPHKNLDSGKWLGRVDWSRCNDCGQEW